jgi:uncharacterized protein (TIGR02271 family)
MTDTENTYDAWIGHQVVDQDGTKLGKVEDLYLDDTTGQPEWLAIKTGLFGNKHSFAPIAGAQRAGDDLQLAFTKDQVKEAPKVDPDGHLEPDEEAELYRHYGREGDYASGDAERQPEPADRDASRDRGRDAGRGASRDANPPGTDDAMTLSEEELAVGTQSHEAGRVRLRKYVVTEDVTTTVPVRKEKVRIERVPIGDAEAGAGGSRSGDASGDADHDDPEHDMVLHEEEIVVEKVMTPKERVHLEKDVEIEEQTITDQVRKEQVDVDETTTGREF